MMSLMRTATGKEDPDLPLLQRVSSFELPASEIVAQINASVRDRHISTSTVQRRLCVSGLHGNLSFEIFCSNCCVFVRRRVGGRMRSECVVPNVKHGGSGVGVLCW
jgi:hypothetical protein